jgi:hypothetical protein
VVNTEEQDSKKRIEGTAKSDAAIAAKINKFSLTKPSDACIRMFPGIEHLKLSEKIVGKQRI